MNLLKCNNLGKQFNQRWLFRNTSININSTDKVSLSGPNGSGKTTLLKILTGISKPSEGKLSIPSWRIAVIGQSPMLYKHLTCLDNLRFFSAAHDQEIRKELKNIQLLMHSNRVLAEFSKGMIQKTLIALAVLRKPDFLFLDEPFTALDQEGTVYLNRQLARLTERNVGYLLIDHNKNRLENLTSRHLFLEKNSLLES